MRRLSISTAHAFLLVYSVDDRASFDEVRRLWEQIKEERTGYTELPCVVAGNKVSDIYRESVVAFVGWPQNAVTASDCRHLQNSPTNLHELAWNQRLFVLNASVKSVFINFIDRSDVTVIYSHDTISML